MRTYIHAHVVLIRVRRRAAQHGVVRCVQNGANSVSLQFVDLRANRLKAATQCCDGSARFGLYLPPESRSTIAARRVKDAASPSTRSRIHQIQLASMQVHLRRSSTNDRMRRTNTAYTSNRIARCTKQKVFARSVDFALLLSSCSGRHFWRCVLAISHKFELIDTA